MNCKQGILGSNLARMMRNYSLAHTCMYKTYAGLSIKWTEMLAGSPRHNLCENKAITKTRLYSFDPLKAHFCIVKLGFTGVYNNFLISAQNIDCSYSLEPPQRGGSNEYPQSSFEQKYKNYQDFSSESFSFFG